MSSSPKNTPKTGIENKGLIPAKSLKLGVSVGVGERVDPRLCLRYENCSIPVCPLDPYWPLRHHRKDDKVCRWLTEVGKNDGPKVLAKYLTAGAVAQVVRVSKEIMNAYIKKAMEKASKTPSKMGLKVRRAS